MISSSGVVESARKGDRFAFQSLVERYQLPINRYIHRLVGDVELARDLTLETFVAAHRGIKSGGKDMRFEAWLHRLATQVVVSALRRRRLARWARRGASVHLSTQDDADAQALQAAILLLPQRAAVALMLLSIGGFSYEEIGQILRASQRSVRQRIAEARAGLLPTALATTVEQDVACVRVQPLLSAFQDHQASGEERALVESHVAGCQRCRATLSAYQELDRRLARMKARGPSVAIAYDVTRVLRGEKLAPTASSGGGTSLRLTLLALVLLLLLGAGGLIALRLGSQRSAGSEILAGTLYVGLQNAEGQVAVVDVRSQRLIATLPIGARPLRLVAARDRQRVYVLDDNGIVSVVETKLNVVTSRYSVSGRPMGMALSPDDKTLYISVLDRRSLILVDALNGREIGDVRVGRSPREVVVSPDGQWVIVFNSSDNSLSKIRVSSKREVRVFPLRRAGDTQTEFASHPMAISADSKKLYVSEVNRERIWTLDLGNDELRSFDVPLRDLGRDILVAPSGDRLFVTHGDPRGDRAALAGLASMMLPKVERTAEIRGFYYGAALSPDGATIFAANPDENVVIIAEAETLQTTATIPVGLRPATVVYVPGVR